MIKTRFIKPYNSDGTTRLTKFRGKKGVYIIRKIGTLKPSYIGYSGSDIYKTALRHFQAWNDKTQVRTTYPKTGYMIRLAICKTAEQAKTLETSLIKRYKPKDNPDKLSAIILNSKHKKVASEFEQLDSAPF